MLTIQVDSCPVCFKRHTHAVPAGSQVVELICPTFGDAYQAQLTLSATVLPVHRFNGARQGALLLGG